MVVKNFGGNVCQPRQRQKVRSEMIKPLFILPVLLCFACVYLFLDAVGFLTGEYNIMAGYFSFVFGFVLFWILEEIY